VDTRITGGPNALGEPVVFRPDELLASDAAARYEPARRAGSAEVDSAEFVDNGLSGALDEHEPPRSAGRASAHDRCTGLRRLLDEDDAWLGWCEGDHGASPGRVGKWVVGAEVSDRTAGEREVSRRGGAWIHRLARSGMKAIRP